MKKSKEYVVITDIVIPAGTNISIAPFKTIRYVDFGEAVIGFGKDACGTFTMPLDEMLELNLITELK